MSLDQVEPSVSNHPINKPSILVADDSRVVRVSLKKILQNDYEIIEADDGEKAWKILLQNPEIRLVFSDLSMPEMDGIELLRKLRHSDQENICNLPFIVITGREENEETRSQLLNEGANELITKPFDSQNIVDFARQHTEHPLSNNNNPQNTEEFLSGISDKITFSQNARKELSFAIRNKNELALLLLRLDQFEKIKNNYSDPAIEHILITTAEIIRSHTRIEDKVAYFGEGTFAILLPAANAVGTKYLGQHILSDLRAKKFYLGEADDCVTASIGISAPDIKPGITFSELLGLAEQRLQAAINAGGKRLVDKGNATITPVSTLISDSSELQSENSELFRQTEITMRKLAAREVKKIKAEQGPAEGVLSNNVDVNEISDALLLAEQENKLLKEELFRYQNQNEELEQLKKQFHETDSVQQQTRLRLQQVKSDYEEMRIRAEAAESNQSRLEESDNDRSIIEEHLLQESEQLQKKLYVANERIEKSILAYKGSESKVSKFKEQLFKQKEKYEIALADAHMMRSIAEEKLADYEKKLLDAKKKRNPFALTETPTIAPVEKTTGSRINTITLRQPAAQLTPKSANKQSSASIGKHTDGAKRSWPLIFLVLTICGLLGVIGFKIWLAAQETAIVDNNNQSSTMAKPSFPADSKSTSIEKKTQKTVNGETIDQEITAASKIGALGKTNSQTSEKDEEAKLQAEMTLRQMAEKEFTQLSQKKYH